MSVYVKHLHRIELGGLRVTYWESGALAAQTILLLHGFRGSHRGLLPLARHFSNYHVIIPDLPGHGGTDAMPDAQAASYMRFVQNFIQELALTDLIIIGHSFGALPALAYAAQPQSQVQKLILISPIPKASASTYMALPYYLIGSILPGDLRRQWLSFRYIQSPVRRFIIHSHDKSIIKSLMDEGERELQELQPNVTIEAFKSIVQANPNDWLQYITAPMLVITGTQDILTPLGQTIAAYGSHPNISFVPVENMGHYGHVEMANRVAGICHDWLAKEPAHVLAPK